MKNVFLYYLAIIIPFAAIIYLARTNQIDDTCLVICFFSYLLIYRTIIDYLRLLDKNIITKNDFWKLLIPGSRLKYFRELYLP